MAERERDKWDYIYYALIAGTIFFFGMALVGFIGEQLGWWNDVGEWLIRSGSIGGLVIGGITLVVGASRSQVAGTRAAIGPTKDAVHETKEAVHETKAAVEANGSKLDTANEKLDGVDEELSQQTRVLEQIRDRI